MVPDHRGIGFLLSCAAQNGLMKACDNQIQRVEHLSEQSNFTINVLDIRLNATRKISPRAVNQTRPDAC